jgi:hypothetical protein
MGAFAKPAQWGRHILQWTPQGEPLRMRTIAVGALGMAAPVLIGYLFGHLAIGFTIGLGAMLLAGPQAQAGPSPADRPSPATAVAPALLAVIAATGIAGWPWTDPALVALVSAAALLTNYSRPLAVAAIRFDIYLVLSLGLLDGAGDHRGVAALVFGLGALWNIAVRVMLADRTPPPPQSARPQREPTPAQRRAHWRRTLRTLAGWQFSIRLAAGLGIAVLVRHLWPAHHFYWIVLTVALLTERAIEHLPVKTVQRTLGALFGVGLTWLVLTEIPSRLGLAIIVCLLATMVPIARARSYLLYAVLSTPVILIVLDFGKPIEPALLTDRLIATIAGAGIVVAGNLIMDRFLAIRPDSTKAS